MNEVFKLKAIPYYNLGILHNFFWILFTVFIVVLSQFGIWAQRLENKHLLKSETRNPWRVLRKKSKTKNHVTAIVESAKLFYQT